MGSYAIVPSSATGTGLSNYTITYDGGNLAVTKAALTITASDSSKTYGTLASLSGTAFTQSGLVTANGDSITGVSESCTGCPAAAAVGSYAIVPSSATGTGLSNYTITYDSGNLAVTKAALTITAGDSSKTYGTLASLSGTAFTQTGLVTANGDSITGVSESCTGCPAAAAVGSYAIVPSSATGTGLDNYDITYVSGNLAVTKAALTITAGDSSKTYGTLASLSGTAFTQTGLVTANGDSITGVSESCTGCPAAAAVGSYAIVPSSATGTGLDNYDITYVSGNLAVTKAALTITAGDSSKTYGTLASLSGTAFTQTGLVTANGDSITGVSESCTGCPAAAAVGSYSIVPSTATGTGLGNYNITYTNGNLTVNQATDLALTTGKLVVTSSDNLASGCSITVGSFFASPIVPATVAMAASTSTSAVSTDLQAGASPVVFPGPKAASASKGAGYGPRLRTPFQSASMIAAIDAVLAERAYPA